MDVSINNYSEIVSRQLYNSLTVACQITGKVTVCFQKCLNNCSYQFAIILLGDNLINLAESDILYN